jgi:hypothetical protein
MYNHAKSLDSTLSRTSVAATLEASKAVVLVLLMTGNEGLERWDCLYWRAVGTESDECVSTGWNIKRGNRRMDMVMMMP